MFCDATTGGRRASSNWSKTTFGPQKGFGLQTNLFLQMIIKLKKVKYSFGSKANYRSKGVFYHLLKQDIKHVESLPFVFNPNVMEGPQAN